ncbi:hypothetical protein ACFX16_030369 [Malus domestica]
MRNTLRVGRVACKTKSVGSYEVVKVNLVATNNIDGTRVGLERSALDARGGWGMQIRPWGTDEAMRFSAAQGVGLPIAALTAHQCLTEFVGIKLEGSGQQKNILITAAFGGVGQYAVLLQLEYTDIYNQQS